MHFIQSINVGINKAEETTVALKPTAINCEYGCGGSSYSLMIRNKDGV